jgi:hypothetical protein
VSAQNRRLPPPRTVTIIAVVVVLAVATGVYAGLRAPWGIKHPQVKAGVAMPPPTRTIS